MIPAETLTTIALLRRSHDAGHRCEDGAWYNPNAGARRRCAIDTALSTVADDVTTLHTRVHAAAHNTVTAVAVAEGMTGLDLAVLPDEEREGWTLAARMAIEALAAELDRDPAREARIDRLRDQLDVLRKP